VITWNGITGWRTLHRRVNTTCRGIAGRPAGLVCGASAVKAFSMSTWRSTTEPIGTTTHRGSWVLISSPKARISIKPISNKDRGDGTGVMTAEYASSFRKQHHHHRDDHDGLPISEPLTFIDRCINEAGLTEVRVDLKVSAGSG